MKYRIANREEVNKFLSNANGDDYYSIRDNPPADMTYDEYPCDFVMAPINVAWVNSRTGERVDIIYEPVPNDRA